MSPKQKGILCFVLIALCVIFFILLIIRTGANDKQNKSYSTTGFSMGTVLSVTIYGGDGKASSEEIISLLDSLENESISWRKETSEVYKVNQEYEAGVPYQVSVELADYILLTKEISDRGGGLLDITIRPLADAWGIEDGNEVIPSTEDIEEALTLIDYTGLHITTSDGTECNDRSDINLDEDYFITFDEEGMSIDLGAVGKGIACDRVYDYLKDTDITGACIAVGGSIICYGNKNDGTNYSIGIRDPRGDENSVMGVLSIDASDTAMFVSTSGDYEKYFIKDGTRYHHILNPKIGYPADTGTVSATIICDDGALSDALSTICILLDRDEALELVNYYGADAVLIDEDKNVYMTDGIASCFTITNEDYRKYD